VDVSRRVLGKPGIRGLRRIRFRSCVNGAVAHGAFIRSGQPDPVGERCANAWGTRAWQQERALEADPEAISRMCSYALCLVAEVDKRLGPKKPFLQTYPPVKRRWRTR